MAVQEVHARGREALDLGTLLLQRARLADPCGGVSEAADLQWWSRAPRATDDVDRVFWTDDDGPVAGIHLTEWKNGWQVDPVVVRDAGGPGVETVLPRALDLVAEHGVGYEVPIADDDARGREVAEAAGLTAGDRDDTGWLHAADRPEVLAPPAGFLVVDRTERAGRPHPMRGRNGEAVGERLRATSLYDAALDLAVETDDGRDAGYTLFWFDPVTAVGLVEPVRVEDEFQRRGLARALLTAGVDRLVARGARRVKVSWGSEAAGALYRGVGFVPTSTTTWWSSGSTQHAP